MLHVKTKRKSYGASAVKILPLTPWPGAKSTGPIHLNLAESVSRFDVLENVQVSEGAELGIAVVSVKAHPRASKWGWKSHT